MGHAVNASDRSYNWCMPVPESQHNNSYWKHWGHDEANKNTINYDKVAMISLIGKDTPGTNRLILLLCFVRAD